MLFRNLRATVAATARELPTGVRYSAAAPAPSADAAAVRRRPKNFFQLALLFPDLGVGTKFFRKIWTYGEPCYWVVSRVDISRNVRRPHPPRTLSSPRTHHQHGPVGPSDPWQGLGSSCLARPNPGKGGPDLWDAQARLALHQGFAINCMLRVTGYVLFTKIQEKK